MNITIVGMGNVGTQLAVHCAEQGHCVRAYSSKPGMINKELTIINEKGETIHRGVIERATNDDEEAFRNADLIFVVVPAFLMKEYAKKIERYANKDMMVCLVPGTGGGECAFRGCIEKGTTLFGMQRVPSVSRLVEYGKSVRAVGYRNELFVSAIPNHKTEECSRLIEGIVGIRTTQLPNYLNITLTPSNPILHTTRLKCLYKDWHAGVVYDKVPLFYEEWTDETTELLLKCDEEVQQLCKSIKKFDLSYVKSLKIHYESPTAEMLTRKIRSIAGFKGLASPAKEVEGGFVPDFESRYFTADFSYGLSILVQIAEFVGIDVVNMKNTLDWYYGLVGKQGEYNFSDYGINDFEDFIEFYSK